MQCLVCFSRLALVLPPKSKQFDCGLGIDVSGGQAREQQKDSNVWQVYAAQVASLATALKKWYLCFDLN